jgi:hypothetical protein
MADRSYRAPYNLLEPSRAKSATVIGNGAANIRIDVDLKDPGAAGEMPGGMLATTVARVTEDPRRRVRSTKRPVVRT